MTLITAKLFSGYKCSSFVSLHHAIAHASISSPTFGLLHSSVCLYPLIDFPIESEAWRHRRRPLFPFVRRGDDLTGSRMPAYATQLLLDFINWEAAVNYKSIF